ncbi:MAG: UbiD family decarboxylase [Pirellulales bacterium]
MGYASLQAAVRDLESTDRLRRIDVELDARLEIPEIQRRVFAAGGPALLFTRVKNCRFPLLGNLFGTRERTHYLFRDALEPVRRLIELKIDPAAAIKSPARYWKTPLTAFATLPKRVAYGPVMDASCELKDLPDLVSWPLDGGSFITLPQVYTELPGANGWQHSNLGMYRVQLAGNAYAANEVGLHYQIHRGIGVHHAAAVARGEPLRVNIFVGGPPAMALAAVMPLPEGLSELVFAGALNQRRVRMVHGATTLPFHGEADFVISGTIDPTRTKPEGPFGDHLGYYSDVHEFPVMRVDKVFHRRDAIWSFTVVGRPPQEDTMFGDIIHELTGPIIPTVLPGVRGVHAVDASGVHPLLLAIGSERYVPYDKQRKPRELLTQANAILGQGQLSLAKYLFIVAEQDDPALDIHDPAAFFQHVLRRVDWTTDCHFQTRTTIDTLDYSGTALNEGSKLVVAAAGPTRRDLPTELPAHFSLPDGWRAPHVALPGVLVVEGTKLTPQGWAEQRLPRGVSAGERPGAAHEPSDETARICERVPHDHPLNAFPLIVIVDDAAFAARTLNNWIWSTFTRSDPARDIHGIGAFTEHKHWGCRGALVIDARVKPWHMPPLVEDPAVSKKLDGMAVRGGPLAGLWES